nr:CapA family protein [Phytoactinopolyspora alkaliphila]
MSLCGDVMLGRGVDQILPNAGHPRLSEPFVRDARAYLDLAERVNGPIPRPVGFPWPWGEALSVLGAVAPDVRIINLETSVTRSDEFAPGKSVHYRMSPGNIAALVAGKPDVCALANNHILDFGRSGLAETLDTLAGAGLDGAGAGLDATAAERPVAVRVRTSSASDAATATQVVVYAIGSPSSGIDHDWRAGPDRPGIGLVDLSETGAASLAARIGAAKHSGDLVVVSIHWGGNWGYDIPAEHVEFAHRLIDAGVDLVHGHSSHHPRPVEVYRGKLVLYGCGDFINDYEGIAGHDDYRDDLRLLYLATLHVPTGALMALRMVPMRARRMRLEYASDADAMWLASTLDEVSADHGVRVRRAALDMPGGAVAALAADFA